MSLLWLMSTGSQSWYAILASCVLLNNNLIILCSFYVSNSQSFYNRWASDKTYPFGGYPIHAVKLTAFTVDIIQGTHNNSPGSPTDQWNPVCPILICVTGPYKNQSHALLAWVMYYLWDRTHSEDEVYKLTSFVSAVWTYMWVLIFIRLGLTKDYVTGWDMFGGNHCLSIRTVFCLKAMSFTAVVWLSLMGHRVLCVYLGWNLC